MTGDESLSCFGVSRASVCKINWREAALYSLNIPGPHGHGGFPPANSFLCISLFLQGVDFLLQDLATIKKFFQNPFMLLKLSLSIFHHTTMMLNLTQDLAMFLKFVSKILIDRRLFPFRWLNNSRTKSTRTPGDCRGGTTEGTC